ncbi:hypothetical protein [Rossellomorea sp. NS-SX7]|uniref:hypothetical protein n=1 Tax=Rossellomorea sp. NS-SX7 TaxID=3463856 RepID=UPI0040580689
MKGVLEFASSFLLVVSWFIFIVSVYILYWTFVMPGLAFIPFLISVVAWLSCRYLSRRLSGT